MLVVAVAGKLAASSGMRGAPGDRLLVGMGMIPRGEVSLIFATIGLRQHVFGQDIYAALLLVVLATTLLTPPVLRWRLLRLRAARVAASPVVPMPAGGWLGLVPAPGGATVELAAEPPLGEALGVALHAALLCGEHRPGAGLLDWVAALPEGPLTWDRAARASFFELLDGGGPRSWRFLALTGAGGNSASAARTTSQSANNPSRCGPRADSAISVTSRSSAGEVTRRASARRPLPGRARFRRDSDDVPVDNGRSPSRNRAGR